MPPDATGDLYALGRHLGGVIAVDGLRAKERAAQEPGGGRWRGCFRYTVLADGRLLVEEGGYGRWLPPRQRDLPVPPAAPGAALELYVRLEPSMYLDGRSVPDVLNVNNIELREDWRGRGVSTGMLDALDAALPPGASLAVTSIANPAYQRSLLRRPGWQLDEELTDVAFRLRAPSAPAQDSVQRPPA